MPSRLASSSRPLYIAFGLVLLGSWVAMLVAARRSQKGRAIQDVWIVPPRSARDHADAAAHRNYYGTTLRVYDPRIDAWRVQWTDPVIQAYLTQIGRQQGQDIVQEGQDTAGNLRRWSFSEITPTSFRWRGEVSVDGGTTWHLHIEFFARRAHTA